MADQVNVKFGGDVSQLNAAIDVVTSKTQGYNKTLLAQFAEYDKAKSAAVNSMQAIAQATGNAAHAAENLNFATVGAKRELIVLAHEAVSGNFSRIPGSLMVLAERMGGLRMETLALAGAFGVAAYATYQWVSATLDEESAINNVSMALRNHNQLLFFNREQIDAFITGVKMMSGEGRKAATETVSALLSAGNISVEMKQKLISLVTDFAAATHKELPKAAEDLAKLFSEPKKGIEEFARMFPEKVDPALLRTALLTKDINKQQEIMFTMMEGLRGSHLESLNAIEKGWQGIKAEIEIATSKYGYFLAGGSAIEKALGLKSGPSDAQRAAGGDVIRPPGLSDEQKAAADAQEAANQKRRNEVEEILNHRNRLASEEAQIERLRLQEEQRSSEQSFEQKKQRLDAEVALHKITKTQEIEQLKIASEQEYQIQLDLLERERQIANLTPIEKQRIDNQIELLHDKHTTELLRLDAKRAEEQNRLHNKELQQWRPIINTIGRTFDGMLQGILQGTQTWQQAMGNFFVSMAASAVSAIASIIVEWLAFVAVTSIMGKPGTWQDFMQLKTGSRGEGGFGDIFSFDVGTDRVPNDMLAMVHKDEIIIPASQSNAIRSGEASVGGGGNVTISIHAIDTQTGADFLMRNSAAIARAVTHQMRNGNAGLQHAMRG